MTLIMIIDIGNWYIIKIIMGHGYHFCDFMIRVSDLGR